MPVFLGIRYNRYQQGLQQLAPEDVHLPKGSSDHFFFSVNRSRLCFCQPELPPCLMGHTTVRSFILDIPGVIFKRRKKQQLEAKVDNHFIRCEPSSCTFESLRREDVIFSHNSKLAPVGSIKEQRLVRLPYIPLYSQALPCCLTLYVFSFGYRNPSQLGICLKESSDSWLPVVISAIFSSTLLRRFAPLFFDSLMCFHRLSDICLIVKAIAPKMYTPGILEILGMLGMITVR